MLPATASVLGPRKGVLSGGRSAPLPVLAAGVSLSLQLPTDCCEVENGQARRARILRARTHTHIHTHTRTLAHTRQSSINRKAHFQGQTGLEFKEIFGLLSPQC